MRHVTVLYDGTSFTLKWIKAIFWAENSLRDLGISVSFPNLEWAMPRREKGINDILKIVENKEYDIICLAFHHSTSELGRTDESTRANVLKKIRLHCNRIIWFDTADSTGSCLFDVLPYVDKYLKKQLLADLDRYKTRIWGERLFCEYIHNKYGIEDQQLEQESHALLSDEFTNKIGLSWNVGLCDFRDWKLSLLFRKSLNSLPKDKIPYDKKVLDTYFNGTVNDSITGWQRMQCQTLLMNNSSIRCGEVSYRVSSEIYQQEIRNTKSLISPFGWGEICFRDFEAFQFHSVLIKPSLDHLVTFPSFFVNDETYISVDWELSDLYDAIDKVRTSIGREIANRGYEIYKYYRSNLGKEELALHFKNNIL